MKKFRCILALLLCVTLFPTTTLAATVESLDDGVTKIALLISGDLGDMSFWDSANAGLTRFAQDHPEVDVDIIEMGSSDTSKYESTLTKICNSAYDLIIVGSTDMREPLQRAAKKEKVCRQAFHHFRYRNQG